MRKSAKILLAVKALLTSWRVWEDLGRRYGGQQEEERKPLPKGARWVERQPLWKRLAVGTGGDALVVGSLLGTNLALKGGDRSAFSEWSWRSTAVVSVLGALLLWRIRDPITPEELGLEEEDD